MLPVLLAEAARRVRAVAAAAAGAARAVALVAFSVIVRADDGVGILVLLLIAVC